MKHPWEFDETRFGFSGRRVLVTGAAGVFGYELCRQLVTEHAPGLLRLFDQNESGLFHADQALRTVDPACGPRLRLLLGDVRERDRLVRAFEQIDVVIHTATLQNAALCEYNPFEAVQTNLIGVQNVVGAAIEAGVKRVVLVSQGAAVDPVGVLGASHLMAERLVTAAHQASGRAATVFASVRVGELAYPDAAWVASAVEQFRAGVPVALPAPEARRFLLPLGDAARLVLTATQTALGGEVFVCRMPALRMRDLLSLMSRAHHGTVFEPDATAPGPSVPSTAPAAFNVEPDALLSESEVPHTLETPDFLVVLPTDRPAPPGAPLATHPHRVDAQTPLTLGGLESFLRAASALP